MPSGNDGGRFQFDLAGRIEEIGDENHAHRRVMLADQPPPDASKRGRAAR